MFGLERIPLYLGFGLFRVQFRQVSLYNVTIVISILILECLDLSCNSSGVQL